MPLLCGGSLKLPTMRPKKTYQTCLDPHESMIIDELARRTGCSSSSIIRQGVKALCRRYDDAR